MNKKIYTKNYVLSVLVLMISACNGGLRDEKEINESKNTQRKLYISGETDYMVGEMVLHIKVLKSQDKF